MIVGGESINRSMMASIGPFSGLSVNPERPACMKLCLIMRSRAASLSLSLQRSYSLLSEPCVRRLYLQ